jgi:hypothetical protein
MSFVIPSDANVTVRDLLPLVFLPLVLTNGKGDARRNT